MVASFGLFIENWGGSVKVLEKLQVNNERMY